MARRRRIQVPSSRGNDELLVPSIEHKLQRDRSRLRLSIAASVALHAVLLAVSLPVMTRATTPDPEASEEVYLLRDVKLRPPEPEPIVERPPVDPPAEPRRSMPVPEELVPEPMAPEPVTLPVELPLADVRVEELPVPPPPPTPSPAPRRFGGAMTKPVRVAGDDPIYTEIARRARITGVVILEAVIGTDGEVESVDVLKPLSFGLTEAAVEAVETWRFEPARLGDEPVAVIFNLTVRFELS